MAQASLHTTIGDDEVESINESTSLLPPPQTTTPSPPRSQCTWPWIQVVALCITISVIVEAGDQLFSAPKVRLYESIACADYYRLHDPSLVGDDGFVPEVLCKINPVQDRLAMIEGWQEGFDSLPALLLPLVYGYLADKYGRKWVAVLAILGFTLSSAWKLFTIGVLHLPLEFVWLAPLFHMIGGGPIVAQTMLTTVVADVTPPENRSSAFFYYFTSDLIAECLVPPIASVLMMKSLWLPLFIAVGLMAFGTFAALTLPETLPIRVSQPETQPAGAPSSMDNAETSPSNSTLRRRLTTWLYQATTSFEFVTGNKSVMALLFAFLVLRVGRQPYHMFLQYVSKRYHWTLAQAGFLLSLRAGLNIVLFIIVLPYGSNFILSKLTPISKDMLIARVSMLLMISGTMIIAFSPSPPPMIIGLSIYTLGAGFPPILRTLVTAVVESHQTSETSDIGRLYALISVLVGLGSLVAGPLVAWIFTIGIGLGGTWIGLPFLTASGLFLIVLLVLFLVKL